MFYGWYIVVCAFVVALCGFGTGFYGTGVYLALLRERHGWPIALVSSAVTFYYVCSATWIVFVGDAFERFGPRIVVLVGAGALAAGVVMLPVAEAPWQIFPIFFVMSFGWAAMSGAAINVIVAPWFERRRGLAVSLAMNGASSGGVVVPPLLVLATAALGFQVGLAVVAAAMLVVMAPVVVALRRRPEDVGLLPDGAGRPAAATETTPVRQTTDMSRGGLLRDRRFLTISIPFALGLLCQVGFLTHQISYLLQFIDARTASLVVSMTTGAAVVGRTVTGFFVDRVDRRLASAANFGLQAAALGLLSFAESRSFLYLGCVLFGLGVGNTVTLSSLIVQAEFPRHAFSRIVSLVVSLNQFTFAFGPAILGGLRDWSGDYRASFLFCICLQALAVLVVLYGRRQTAQHAAPP